MNRNTLLWNNSHEITVLPKTEIQHYFYTLRSAFSYAQRIFSQVWKTRIILRNFETTVSASESDFRENRVPNLNKKAWTLSLELHMNISLTQHFIPFCSTGLFLTSWKHYQKTSGFLCFQRVWCGLSGVRMAWESCFE